MKMRNRRQILLVCLVLLFTGGCTVPLAPKITGPVFSREALAFLNLPDTTRGDVVASLGAPLIEAQNPGVLVYVSDTTPRTWDVIPFILPNLDDSEDPFSTLTDKHGHTLFPPPPATLDVYTGVGEGVTKEQALFVAYDEHGHVFAHKICAVNQAALLSASVQWRLSEGKKHKATGRAGAACPPTCPP
jgi:hypothetical protein